MLFSEKHLQVKLDIAKAEQLQEQLYQGEGPKLFELLIQLSKLRVRTDVEAKLIADFQKIDLVKGLSFFGTSHQK